MVYFCCLELAPPPCRHKDFSWMNQIEYTQKHKFVVDSSQQDNNNSQDLHVVYSIDEKSLIGEKNPPHHFHEYCFRA